MISDLLNMQRSEVTWQAHCAWRGASDNIQSLTAGEFPLFLSGLCQSAAALITNTGNGTDMQIYLERRLEDWRGGEYA